MRQALELALEALQMLHDENMDYLTRNKLGGENNQCMVFARETITAIKEALAQPEQEPVAYLTKRKIGGTEGLLRADMVDRSAKNQETHDFIPLYTTPPHRTWVGLNKEEAFELQVKHKDKPFSLSAAVENLLREKNQ